MAVPRKPTVTAATGLTTASPILALADRRRRSNAPSADVTKTANAVPDAGERARTNTVDGHDSYSVTAFADIVDRSLHAAAARFTMGLSPAALAAA